MSVSPPPGPDHQRLNTLCEQGARSAAEALALFLGEPRPRVTLSGVESATYGALLTRLGGDDRVLSVGFGIAGAVSGVLALLVEEGEAMAMLERLVPGVTQRGFDERARGAFCEVGNILASAFLNELASTLRTSCIPSVPSLIHDAADAALRRAMELDTTRLGDDAERPGWLVTAELEREGTCVAVRLVIMPGDDSIERLIEADRR